MIYFYSRDIQLLKLGNTPLLSKGTFHCTADLLLGRWVFNQFPYVEIINRFTYLFG